MLATVPLTGGMATYSAPVAVLGAHTISAVFSPSGVNYSAPNSPATLVQQVQAAAIERDPATGQFLLAVGGTAYDDVINISVKTVSHGNDQYGVEIDTQNGRHSTSFFAKGVCAGHDR